MTYHFVNILTWKYFKENQSLDRKIYIDGFLLKLAIFLVSNRWVQKRSGVNFYSPEKFVSALFLTAYRIEVENYYVLPFWQNLEEIVIDNDLLKRLDDSSDIVIGISSPKQDRLADLIRSLYGAQKNIYCLGAAIYAKPVIKSEFLLITWFTMFFSSPIRTMLKFKMSVPVFFDTITLRKKEFLQFINLITYD